jgi:hypothetical protein
MAVAKIAPYNFVNVKKKIKKALKKGKELLPSIFPPASKAPGQMDYPALPRAFKRKKKISGIVGE